MRSALCSGRCIVWDLTSTPLSQGGILQVQGKGTLDFINNKLSQQFVGTAGGSWKYEDQRLVITFEFNTIVPDDVGKEVSIAIDVKADQLISTEDGRVWDRVDDGTPGALSQAWLITGRERNGEMRKWTPGVRKTMKILSGTRFQWIAYNTETGEFFGTGGGTYTTENGKYTENIEFFSRNKDRVGASLQFDYELIDGQWHHRGKSSSGNPIFEIWSTRSSLK